MGDISIKAACRRQLKKSYKGLNSEQKRYIKAKERYEQMEKALTYFYSHCRRTANGAVDFKSMSEKELDDFEYWNKEKDRAYRCMSRLEDVIDVDYTLAMFMQMNLHSVSF